MERSKLTQFSDKNTSIQDESLFSGKADSFSAPESTQEVCDIVRICISEGITVTPRGGLTGINGAGTTSYGHSLDLRKLNTLKYNKDDCTLWAQAGATFSDIEAAVKKESGGSREFPASPTEKSATVGGAVSFDACGLRSYKYGKVSDFVTEIEYCDSRGELHMCRKADMEFHELLNSEGMLAVITGVRLRTVPVPGAILGLFFFFNDETYAAGFADDAAGADNISVLEYIDHESIGLIREYRSQISSISRIPEIPQQNDAVIYIELEGDDEDELELAAENLLEIADEHNGDTDNIWTAAGSEIETFRLLRHAVSECVNMKIAEFHAHDEQICKLSFSAFIPDKTRQEIIRFYRDSLRINNLSGVIFGHIGSGSPYVNIISESAEEYYHALSLIGQWSRNAFGSGGCAFHECGVGKLFRDVYSQTLPPANSDHREELKNKWDPQRIFNPQNMLLIM